MSLILDRIRRGLGVALMLAFAALASMSAAHAQTTDEIVKRGKILIGVCTEAVPVCFLDDKQESVGFEIDLAKMLAERMGVELELVQVPGASRIQYLLAGKVDILIAFLGVTPERALQVDYSQPYFISDSNVLASADVAISSYEDLKNLRVAVVRGTTSDRFLTKKLGEGAVLRFDDTPSMYQALISGQIDVVTDTLLNAAQMMKQNESIKLEKKFAMFSQINGIAIRRDNQNLLNWLNSFVGFAKASGELGVMYEKWFERPMPNF
ncbi:MAG: transporter substrate-binding domain-containing protein [Rhizobiaceae bacterium]|nr:transporter substrate-binding domain-containing protein [Rhizobiaceae bacterium]